MHMPNRIARLLCLLLVTLLIGACAAGGAASAPPSPGASGAPSAGPIADEVAASQAVKATNPLLLTIPQQDPDLIGQSATWSAVETGDGWELTFEVGWGDCMAGCIDRHVWVYAVGRDGTVELLSEEGEPIPAEELAKLGAGVPGPTVETGVRGLATAGPTCPVEQPGDPACAPRPVPGAVLIVRGADGTEAARVQTDGIGAFEAPLEPGDYVLEAQAVEGLMGVPGPIPFRVDEGVSTVVEVLYDTGIRGAEGG